MSYYKQLLQESGDLAEHITNELHADKMLSTSAAANVSFLHEIIRQYIRDYISECMSDDAADSALE